MAEPQMAPNPDEIVSEILIAAPRERVFQALVDPVQVPQWWGTEGQRPISAPAGNGAASA